MLNLPNNTILGKLRIEAVFQFYDIPRLFACANNSGTKFLALSVFDDYESFNWLYLPVSVDRLSTIVNKGIALREAFLSPEDGYLFEVESSFSGESTVRHIFPEQIPLEDLPDEAAYLESEESFNIGLGVVDADVAAVSSRRETYNLHFYPWDTKLPEIDAKNLGGILTSFQELSNALGQYCKGDITLKGAIPTEILEATKFRATQIFEGSFGLQLKSKSTSDLFHSSLASDVLLELTKLIESRDSEDNISNKLHELKGRVASKYRSFLGEVAKLDSPMRLHWGSPNSERGRVLLLSKQEIKKAFDLVSKIDINMSESVVFRAELLGLDTKTKRYRVRHLNDNEDYSGKIVDESLEAIRHSEINGIYNVTLKKIIETNFSSGAEYTKWALVALEPVTK
ncbi:hypothetical protein RN346_15235 [Halomonas sp. PAMB 3232]|uniref:DUF6575 domain-containing protein n=1 Tax=Halomonas sp. PAMB 3232 TaxID=3075221 RepID=UPI00289861F7|nr:DUF6575 domain-containing protein [Halomonas sp. PAMB 3232]WNL38630.1 hypothetical protein RN346_15235 [Halomonas sp. PAMB 3232]